MLIHPFITPSTPVPNHHTSTGRATIDKSSPLLQLIQKKGLLGFTVEMREQLADALGADVVDQDLVENILVVAYSKHLEICSAAGTIGGEICRGDLAHQHV